MKRKFLFIIALFVSITLFANRQGHFFLNVEDENVQVSNVESKFVQWLDIPENTTFTPFRDETDNLGIRHISYQQYVNGDIVENCMILVHSKDNIVYAVNGDIMDATTAAKKITAAISPLNAARKVRKNAKSNDATFKIVRINNEFRYAYEVMSEDFTAKKYVDAETGEIIKIEPLVYYADVAGTAATMYSGIQAITCYEDNGKYYLIDEARGIVTLDATNNEYHIDYDKINKASITESKEVLKSIITEEWYNFIHNCSNIYNTSTTWTSSWNMQLTSVTIGNVIENSSWYTLGEDVADVYIKIKNKSGSVLYESGYKDDPTFPTTFNIAQTLNLSSPPYTIEIWDYDPIGDDDFIEKFTISTIYGQNMDSYIWQGRLTAGVYAIESIGKQPLLDAHWGMGKTLDFYSQKFNRNSFDDKGAIVYNIVNPPQDTVIFKNMPANAQAYTYAAPYPMVYGMAYVSSETSS